MHDASEPILCCQIFLVKMNLFVLQYNKPLKIICTILKAFIVEWILTQSTDVTKYLNHHRQQDAGLKSLLFGNIITSLPVL